MPKFLIIQTAFIGDVVLATALIEKLKLHFPEAKIDFLLRKGNESLLLNNPALREVLIWDKKKNKLRNLWKMLRLIRKRKYNAVINVQRFAATGLLTAFSRAKQRIGFDKNPLSFFFTTKIKHEINNGMHEVERNAQLIAALTDPVVTKPRLYPTVSDRNAVEHFKDIPYITISPASVWFTKQYPKEKWISFINQLPVSYSIFLLGAGSDSILTTAIAEGCTPRRIVDLSGKLSFLQSAALMQDAMMNYVNDSAPLHFASAMNAPVTAVYCSTVPAFGFGPLSTQRFIVETKVELACRPCGLHGWKACPLGHFNCAHTITDPQLLATLPTNA